MRLATVLALIVSAAGLLLGCGSGSRETTPTQPAEATATKAEVRAQWERSPKCAHPQGASRWGCSVGTYRCQAVVSGRGWSVDCAKPGRSIGFTVPPRK